MPTFVSIDRAMHPDDHAASLRRAEPGGPETADAPEPESPEILEPGPPDRPASDAQLLRLGRLLGLRFGEAEALLESLAETPPPPLPAVSPALRARLLPFSPELLEALQAVPGVFLLTDGVTPTQLARARDRARAALAGAARLGRLRDWAEAAAEREVGLLGRAGQALCEGLRGGRLGDAAAGLGELLRPLLALRPGRRGSRGKVRGLGPRKPGPLRLH